jgi:predicted GNAT family acetyltransferase
MRMTPAGADIAAHEADGRGRFFLDVEGGEAELTYAIAPAGVMRIDRTYVPPPARGGDIAMRLVRRAVGEAEGRGLKIDPRCSYVARVFDFMPEWAHLRAGAADRSDARE